MLEKFNKLDEMKRRNIINVATREFVESGYEKASTNKISAEAGISKGSLFFYFGNKKNMYLFLLEFAVEKYVRDFFKKIDFWEIDLLARLQEVIILKVKLMTEYPYIFKLIECSKTETSDEVKKEIEQKITTSKELHIPLTRGIDSRLFKEELNFEESLRTIFWAIDGLSNELSESIKKRENTDLELSKEVVIANNYIDFLRTTFYKK